MREVDHQSPLRLICLLCLVLDRIGFSERSSFRIFLGITSPTSATTFSFPRPPTNCYEYNISATYVKLLREILQ